MLRSFLWLAGIPAVSGGGPESIELATAVSSQVSKAAPCVAEVLGVDDACTRSPQQAEGGSWTSGFAHDGTGCALGAVQIKAYMAPAMKQTSRGSAMPLVLDENHTPEASVATSAGGAMHDRSKPQWSTSRSSDSFFGLAHFILAAKGSISTMNRRFEPQHLINRPRRAWQAGYERARLLWAARGESVPIWVDGPRSISFIESSSYERVSLLVPIVGIALLLFCILGLLASKAWLKSVLASREVALVPAAALTETVGGVSDGSTVSTREPSEAGNTSAPTETENAGESGATVEFYRFASPTDKLMIGIAVVLSSLHGAAMPMTFYFCDNMFKAINLPNDDGTIPPTAGPHTNREAATWRVANVYLILACMSFIARFGAITLCAIASDHMVLELKKAFFSKLLQQGPAWHDVNNSAELSARLSQDAWAFKEGSGEQLVNVFRSVAMFWSAVLLSFLKDWRMALVMVAALPIAGFATATSITVVKELLLAQGEVYISAGGIAQTAFQMIRTVSAFNGQLRSLQAYREKLQDAESYGVRQGILMGFCGGISLGVVGFAMSIGLYAGSCWILSGYESECWVSDPPFGTCRTGGSILSAMMTMLWGFTMGLGSLSMGIESISSGRAAAQRLYHVIDQPLVVETSGGEVLDQVEGTIAYEHVRFSYPGRLSALALRGVSLHVPAGTTAAFVGPSGSGKSTLVSLLLRFYDPQGGAVTLDGHDIRSLQVAWLRSRMALVEQEPVLFGCSIAENIAYGYDGAVCNEEVEKAAKMANAHDFVSRFPRKFQTDVGERGAQLSGGQKQRIAIARALIRDPAVLLLDEATSALDVESEKVVQDALDKLLQAKQRTTLIIAHRLTTVQAADQIYVMQEGLLVEQGKHSELLAKTDSVYASLAKAQHTAADLEASDKSTDASTPEILHATLAIAPTAANALVQSGLSQQTSRTGMSEEESYTSKSDTSDTSQAAWGADSKPEPKHVPLWRLYSHTRPEFGLYAFGFLSTVILSLQTPIVFARLTQTVNLFNSPPVVFDIYTGGWVPDFDAKAVKASVSALCFTQQIIGVMGIVIMTAQFWAFSKAGARLTARLRLASLEAILKQEMAWFDSTTSGALSHNLAVDVPSINFLVGPGVAPLLQSALMLMVSFGAALFFSWRFTLCILAVCPLLAIGNLATQYAFERRTETASAGVVSESLGNIKTVAAFGLQGKLLDRFMRALAGVKGTEMYGRFMHGLGTGCASSAMFLIHAVTVVCGTRFVDHGVMSPDKAALCLFMLVSGVGGLAELVRFAERATQAQAASNRVFELLDRTPLINSMDPSGNKPPQVHGRIEFRDVHFWYPARPDVSIFQGFTLTMEPNTSTALVGHSGSGKSTVVGLLQRFYDPHRGSVTLDGQDLRDLNLAWLRSQMGLVQQEPALMTGTVLDSICYGLSEVSEEAAVEAAKLANAHAFIMQLPDQYHTSIGFSRSSQFSGGQKQRIAIARAIARDPAILLLDEATSALDATSERVVQEALDSLLVTKRRTTIVIAHRLSTVQNADQICVVHQGRILEKGKHEELLADPDGHYSRLVKRQVGSSSRPAASQGPAAEQVAK